VEAIPPAEVRRLIGDALHHAVAKLFEPSIIHIAPINTIGCFLLQHLFRREYRPVCGSVRVRGGGQPFALEADPSEIEAHEYYLWIDAVHPDGKVERVDFGTRYWTEWARGMGVLWLGGKPPAPLWGWAADLPADLAEYEFEPTITARVQNLIGEAIAHRTEDSPAATWEKAINDALDYMAATDEGMAFLVQVGAAEPIEDDEASE
jgi:hypothetical protein